MTVPLNAPPAAADGKNLLMGFGLDSNKTMEAVGAMVAQSSPPPQLDPSPRLDVELPAGWISPQGDLVRTARVRELTGYDEEFLSRLSTTQLNNPAVYVTELLALGVDDLGGDKPSKDVLRDLLIGDRDALMLGIRKASYGSFVKFDGYKCLNQSCAEELNVSVDIDDDVKTIMLDDPYTRTFTVELRNGSAEIVMVDGRMQEMFQAEINKRTPAEMTTLMLSRSIIAVRGKRPLDREEAVRQLSSGDRATLVDFLNAHQPGPKLGEPIYVNCPVCNTPFPIILGLGNLFRF
jgi:hypothetical protein